MNSTLRDYSSPPWETSLYKNIPISKYTPEKLVDRLGFVFVDHEIQLPTKDAL